MSSDNDKILWNQSLETGVEKIDEQHRILVDTINKAHRLVCQNYSQENIQSVIKDLIYYTQFHFETEEALMQTSDYLDTHSQEYEKHINEHLGFSTQVLEFSNALQKGVQIEIEYIINYLCEWLIHHIVGTDQKLGDFLATSPIKRDE